VSPVRVGARALLFQMVKKLMGSTMAMPVLVML
jgi:hypothetical protein